jgi:hypothetical protein
MLDYFNGNICEKESTTLGLREDFVLQKIQLIHSFLVHCATILCNIVAGQARAQKKKKENNLTHIDQKKIIHMMNRSFFKTRSHLIKRLSKMRPQNRNGDKPSHSKQVPFAKEE